MSTPPQTQPCRQPTRTRPTHGRAEPSKLLAANPIDCYLLNSTMLAQFRWDADGGLTLLIQHESPGKDTEANWLPAPEGPFSMMMRVYWPQAAALDGSWKAPPLKRVP